MALNWLRYIIVALACALSVTIVHAQAYPKNPIKLIIPYPPGGATDRLGRQLAMGLGKRFGQILIVENRAGATGSIGIIATVNAPPDGHTIVLGTGGTIAVDAVFEKLPYNPARDLVAVAPVASIPFIIVVNSNFPPRTISELIALAKREPGKINFASSGTGAPAHLTIEYLMALANIKMVHIPYKGATPAYNDVAGGQVQLLASDVASALPLIQGGHLRPLAVTSAERVALLPNVPTVAESGLPGYEMGNWFGIFAPVKTPADIVALLSKAINAAVQEAEFKRGIELLSAVSMVMTKPEFDRYIAGETTKRVDLIKANNIVVER